ncbi:MAG: hypothetical protein H7039_07055 [Bryobacteraceae bacterium]|nr:hypothetical protein [Bryobacteraceae bacterium]
MDHINVKLFAVPGTRVPWPDLIPIFHRWIRENVLEGTLIDVADYAHVPDGPGVLLVAHDAIFSVDNREGQPGFLYNQRTSRSGSAIDKLIFAYDQAANAAKLLEQELPALRFQHDNFEVFLNDRGTTADAGSVLTAAVEALCVERFGSSCVTSEASGDSRHLPRFRVRPAG